MASSIDEIIMEFLRENEFMIIDIAAKRLGPRFNKDEVFSVATIACYESKIFRRDQYKKTKDTTTFWWYYNKGLDALQGIDGGEVRIKAGRGDFEVAESLAGIDFNRLYMPPSEEESQAQGHGERFPAPQEFFICMQSFHDNQVSKKVLDSLRILTRRSNGEKGGIEKLSEIYKCSRESTIRKKMFKEIVDDLKRNGLNLYKAYCLNGVSSVVVACAGTVGEAENYFKGYGNIECCMQLIYPEN